jgi:hypothetical protein
MPYRLDDEGNELDQVGDMMDFPETGDDGGL